MHPLADVLRAASDRRFPAADGAVERLPPWRSGVEAVVAMTGHGYLCTTVGHDVPEPLRHLAADGFGGLTDPRLVTALAGPDAGTHDVDSLDVLLVATAATTSDALLEPRDDLAHPRIEFARRVRDDVRVLAPVGATTADVVVVLGTGVAGLPEVSVEIAPGLRDSGLARSLIRAALGHVDASPVVAMVAPGNAASLRAFLAAGFAPVGSAQIWHRPT